MTPVPAAVLESKVDAAVGGMPGMLDSGDSHHDRRLYVAVINNSSAAVTVLLNASGPSAWLPRLARLVR